MEGETSWVSHCFSDVARVGTARNTAISENNNGANTDVVIVSLDQMPDDLMERIIAYLPIVSIFRAGSVCKRWYGIVSSGSFLWNLSNSNSHKPWYFMFTNSDEAIGYAYDPVLRKWYGIDLPCIETSNWFIASSSGLICFMDNDTHTELYVCNPITKRYKKILEPPGFKSFDYIALAISVNKVLSKYSVTVVKSKQDPGNFLRWDLSVQVYDSVAMTWTTPMTEVLTGWRSGDESMICGGVLYVLVYSMGGLGYENRHGLLAYDLSSTSNGSLTKSSILIPYPLTCGRLMNLKEKLVMVGGIGKIDRPDIIKGIGIWVLNGGREWQEVGRMPHRFFQGFGEFDDVFASSGFDDLIYIQSYGSPALLVFDMKLKLWKWSQKCPVTKRFPLQLFTGFCFDPRLEISP